MSGCNSNALEGVSNTMRSRTIFLLAGLLGGVVAVLYVGGLQTPSTGTLHEIDITTGLIRSERRLFGAVLFSVEDRGLILDGMTRTDSVPSRWKVFGSDPLLPRTVWRKWTDGMWGIAVAERNVLRGIISSERLTPEAARRASQTVIDLWCADDDPHRAIKYIQAISNQSSGAAFDGKTIGIEDLPPSPSA